MTKCRFLVFILLCVLVVGAIDSYSKTVELEQTEELLSVQLNDNATLRVKYDVLNDDIIQGTCLTRSGFGK